MKNKINHLSLLSPSLHSAFISLIPVQKYSKLSEVIHTAGKGINTKKTY